MLNLLEEIKPSFKRINIFVGDNGVGKTTLLNKIFDCEIFEGVIENGDYERLNWINYRNKTVIFNNYIIDYLIKFNYFTENNSWNGLKKIDYILSQAERINKKNSIINCNRLLIDDIETNIHYSRQKDFMKDLMQIMYDNDLQLFFSTHSYEFIEYTNKAYQEFYEDLEDKKKWGGEDELRLFMLGRSVSTNRLHSTMLKKDNLSSIIEQNREVR